MLLAVDTLLIKFQKKLISELSTICKYTINWLIPVKAQQNLY